MRSLLPGDGLGLTSLDHRDHPVHLDHIDCVDHLDPHNCFDHLYHIECFDYLDYFCHVDLNPSDGPAEPFSIGVYCVIVYTAKMMVVMILVKVVHYAFLVMDGDSLL